MQISYIYNTEYNARTLPSISNSFVIVAGMDLFRRYYCYEKRDRELENAFAARLQLAQVQRMY